MLTLLPGLAAWAAGRPVAVATVVATGGSVPRPVGTAMAVRDDGAVLGSLSGGCVEGAVHAEALEALADGRPRRASFGWSDDDAFAVGLTCGGSLDVLVQPFDARTVGALCDATPGGPAVLVRRLPGPDDGPDDRPHDDAVPGAVVGPVLGPVVVPLAPRDPAGPADPAHPADSADSAHPADSADSAHPADSADPAGLAAALRPMLARDGASVGEEGALHALVAQVGAVVAAGGSAVVRADAAPRPLGEPCAPDAHPASLLVETRLAPPLFVVVGADDVAGALVRAVRLLGYRVVLVDPRPVFARPERFPDAHEVVRAWPDRYLAGLAADGALDARSGVAVLTHDARVDVPVLRLALSLPLGYVGAMGSRRSHAHRVAALRAAGVGDDALARLRSPIGLDLGAVTPAEVAVSVVAEVVALRHGRARPLPLSTVDGPLHAPPPGEPDEPHRPDRPDRPEGPDGPGALGLPDLPDTVPAAWLAAPARPEEVAPRWT